jgi:eukaryotic-like serine/threonine-protein kinase
MYDRLNSSMATKGRYEILEVLGEGGMGIVYRAIDPVMNHREVAVKTIRDPQDKAALDLFKRECAVLTSITHPNIVDIWDIGETEEEGAKRPFFVMPLLQGTTLQELIKTSSPRLTVERSVQMIAQVCRGLQAAHDHGLVHRDLKPSNLFVLPDDSVKIIDFGMAHLTNNRSATGLKGTLLYMAPEQLQLKQPTPLSDQFSLAVVCYEMLARRHPFSAAGHEDLGQAILHYTPPPVSEFNPLVNSSICQVIHKALAKQPFHRFPDVRTFSDCLQKALRGEPIEIFDPARIAPRLARARRAFEAGDLDDAAERIKELESESFLAPEIDELHKAIEEARRAKTVNQLLETAHRRFEEGEYVRALQKVQEVLNLDSSNTDAFTLRGAIESKRSGTQIEEWFRLANQHMENHAYAHARQALEKVLDIRPKEVRAQTLLAEVERREQEHIRLRNEKEEAYQSALNAYRRGDVNSAFTKAERLLDLDRRAPYSSSPDQAAAYQKLYEEVRSKRDQLASQEAEARRCLEGGNFAAAKAICDEVLAAYPNNVLFGALRDDVEQARRREISAYLANIEREVAAEPDLNRKVAILEEANQKYPSESRFKESLQQVRSRRDLVDSIAGRARASEEGRQFSEALGLWEMLRGIYPKYPGLEIEIGRLCKRREQQLRAETKDHWVTQIDQAVAIRNHDKASSLASDALAEFPGDPELSALAKQIQQAQTRALEAVEKTNRGKDLYSAGNSKEALDLLREALQLDAQNPVVRAGLLEILLKEAGPLIDADWRAAERLVQEVLELDPSNPGARSFSTLIQDKRQAEDVSAALSKARELRAQGNIKEAIAELDKLHAVYPRENRLIQLRSVFQEGLPAREQQEVRAHDLQELKELARQSKETKTVTELDSIFLRTEVYSKYGGDPEFQEPISEIEARLRQERGALTPIPLKPKPPTQESSPPPPSPPVITKSKVVSAGKSQGKRDVILHKTPPRFLWPAAGFAVVALTVIFAVHKFQRRPAPPPRLGTIRVTFQVDPPDATIRVDNQEISGTTADVAPGKHTVHIEKLGYIAITQPFSDRDASPIAVKLDPSPQKIFILADEVKAPRLLLDGAEKEPSEDGSYLADLGKHTLSFWDGKVTVFSLEFEAQLGAPTRLAKRPRAETPNIPVMAVSSLGSQAFAYSSEGMPAGLKDGDQRPIPVDGLELVIPAGGSEVTFGDPTKPVSLPVQFANAPGLTIRVGAATKGVLTILSNVDAQVFIDASQRPTRIRAASNWQQPLTPGSHRVRLASEGYDELEKTVTIVAGKTEPIRFELTPSITNAYLRVDGGTPDAQVFLDDRVIGKLDANGSFGPSNVPADTDHRIVFKKQNFEDLSLTKKGVPAKQTILISGSEARLKEYGSLDFMTVSPSGTQLTYQGRGGAPKQVADWTKPIPLPEGTYTVRGTADQYEPFGQDVQIRSGQPMRIEVRLTSKPPAEPKAPPPDQKKAPPPVVQLPDLFRDPAKYWRRDEQGFWTHDGPVVWFKDFYFTKTFEVFLKRGTFRTEKLQWKTFLDDTERNYFEFELSDKELKRREWVDGKSKDWEKPKAHGIAQGGPYKLTISIQPDRIENSIGHANDIINRKVAGATGFDGKIDLKLVQ